MKKSILLVAVLMLSGMVFAQDAEKNAAEENSGQMIIEMPAKSTQKVVNTKMLYDFEDEAELKDFAFKSCVGTINDETKFVKTGKKSLQLEFNAEGGDWGGMYSGVHEETATPVKKDWSGDFNCLRMDIYNTLPEAVSMACRIDDEKSQNYKTRYNNDEVVLKPGWTTVKINFDYLRQGEGKAKAGKKIDIKNIRLFSLFTAQKREMLFYVDNIRLDKLVDE